MQTCQAKKNAGMLLQISFVDFVSRIKVIVSTIKDNIKIFLPLVMWYVAVLDQGVMVDMCRSSKLTLRTERTRNMFIRLRCCINLQR